jgi:uncharacterized tellurite resistance protein B-like protein
MEELNKQQKLAILWVLNGIMNADKKIHKKEEAYFNEIKTTLGLAECSIEQINDIDAFAALAAIKDMSATQKMLVAKLMGKMIVVDEDINYEEVKLYNNVCQFCDINQIFDIDDYPDYTLSGDFPDIDD